MEFEEIRSILEAILFASGDEMPIKRLAEVLDCSQEEVIKAAASLGDKYSYERSGIRIAEMEETLQLISAPEYSDYVRKALETRKPRHLSEAAMETLAIIAYNQPVTKSYVEKVRGVDSSYSISILLNRGMIEEAGRLPVPGRPILYNTSINFLRSFGLSSLSELPDMPEVVESEETQLRIEELTELIEAKETAD